MSGSLSKVVMEHSQAHLFLHCLWPFSNYSGEVETLQQRLQSLKYLLSSPLRKKFSNLLPSVPRVSFINCY